MNNCAKCFDNFNGICANVFYGKICEEIKEECDSYSAIPSFLSQKPRVLNPKYYTREMELEDQGCKEVICGCCKEAFIVELGSKKTYCDKCKKSMINK